MDDAQPKSIRPTKKQHQLLAFIEEFISANGYSPSYREIKTGLKYNSVATVSLHVNNLIERGHLRKRGHSARSLELAKTPPAKANAVLPKQLNEAEEKWLLEKIDIHFKEAEELPIRDERKIDELHVLVGALRVLGLAGAANAYNARLA